jgi:hypothetical protein
VSSEPFTQYLVDQLKEIERNWELEPALFEQVRTAVQREIDVAESLIANAGHPAVLFNDPRQEGALQRLLSAMDHAEWFLTNARNAYTSRKGEAYRREQTVRGHKGAEARWHSDARKLVDEMIENLKGARYSDWTAHQKWDELLSMMAGAQAGEDRDWLDPQENWIKGNADKSTISYRGDKGTPITYKTFKNKLSR